jgi:membrane protein
MSKPANPRAERRLRFSKILKDTLREWREDRISQLGAALAFYSFFSVGPLLVIAVVLAGIAYRGVGQAQEAQQQFREQLESYVGAETAATVEQLMAAASRSRANRLATMLGAVGLLFSATGAVVALKDAMNVIWGVMPPPDATLWWTIRDRLRSLLIVAVVGGLLLVSSALSTVLWSLANVASERLPFSLPVAQGIDLFVSFVAATLLFAAIFKLLPDVRIAWRDVLVGAVITAALFLVGKYLFSVYVSYVSVGSAYGTAGSLAVLLLFAYYSAQVFFLGAEFTQVYAREMGTRISPSRGAIRATEALRQETAALRKIERQESSEKNA